MSPPPLGICWQPSSLHGWGVFGINLAHRMALGGRRLPVFLGKLDRGVVDLDAEQNAVINLVFGFSQDMQDRLRALGPGASVSFPVLVGLGEAFAYEPYPPSPAGEHGILFLTDTYVAPDRVERAKRFSTVVAGAAWTGPLLKSRGIDNVKVVIQGIDSRIFKPGPRPARREGRFTVFSGGKLEYRKGQDIVIAAWREFHRRHPDSQLVFAWNHPYPDLAKTVAIAGHVTEAPDPWGPDPTPMAAWLGRNGLPPGSFRNLGLVPNRRMPEIFAGMDAAVFTSRAEGGTNLVAMECMACGVPTILSANTGHLDLIRQANCYPLGRQGPVAGNVAGYVGTEGWGESDPEELIEALEAIYADRAEAERRGRAGAALLATISWEHQVPKLLDAVGA